MEIKVLEEKFNALFKRKEVRVEISSDLTPSRAEAEKILCDKFSCNKDCIRINKIQGLFGIRKFIIIAEIYTSKKDRDFYAPALKKRDIEAEKKEAEANKKPKEKSE